MLIEIFECVECGRRLVRIGGNNVKVHNCSGSIKLMADAKVSMLRLRDMLKKVMEKVYD